MIPRITTTPTVLATLLARNGTHPAPDLRAALRQAGIPPDAPYSEWEVMISRALTLLPAPPGGTTEGA